MSQTVDQWAAQPVKVLAVDRSPDREWVVVTIGSAAGKTTHLHDIARYRIKHPNPAKKWETAPLCSKNAKKRK